MDEELDSARQSHNHRTSTKVTERDGIAAIKLYNF
jgi:hypothetical protein